MMIGVGYSFSVWKNLYVEPNYMMPMNANDDGKREGELRLGVAYRL